MKLATSLPLLVALALPAAAQEVGSAFPRDIELDEFVGIEADSLADLSGRLILVEWFAYW